MLVIPVNSALAYLWYQFELDDAGLIGKSVPPYDSAFVASLNDRSELLPLLASFADYKIVVFRTSEPVIEKWVQRFSGLSSQRPGHRTRWLVVDNPELWGIARKAKAHQH